MLHKYKYKYSYAASSPWTQSNWAGGSGQTSWSDITKFSTSTNVTTSTPNQITLASAEKFSNTTFDTDLTSWTGTQSYTLDDEFTTNRSAGAVNGTSAEPTGGTRTVTDTGSKISIASSALTFATGETTNDGLWYTSLARGAGKTLFQKIVPSDTNGIINIGWDTNTSGAINDRLVFAAAGVLQIVPNGGSAIAVGTYTATTYYIAGVMRSTGFYWYIKGGAFTNWSLLWQSASGTAAGIPSLNVGSTTSVFTADDIRVPTTTWMPTPLAYDSFTRADGAIGSTETTGPDSQTTSSLAWTGGAISSNTNVITPTLGSELLTDGGLENWTSATNLTSWTEQIAGTSTVNQESSTIHGGTYSVREDIDASNNFGQIFQALTNFGIGNYGSVTYWARSSATGKTLSFAQNSNSGPARNPGTTWTQYTDTFRS
ncbi:MAG TPA: hypothetical protein VL401_01415, partial [Alphaproteobacteria bacterium]|nr:hypothetical protein [Alphaproteobacteria bacterium]